MSESVMTEVAIAPPTTFSLIATALTAKAVGASIHTEADTLESLRTAIREAVACHFEEGHGPRVIRLHLVRDELLAP